MFIKQSLISISIKKHWQLFVVFTVIAIALFFQNLISNDFQGSSWVLTKIFIALLLVYNLYALLIPLFLHLRDRYSLKKEKFVSNFIVHLAASLLSAALHLFISQIIYQLLWEMPGETFRHKLTAIFQRWFYIEVLVYWLIILASHYTHGLKQGREKVTRDIAKIAVQNQGQTLLIDYDDVNWLQAYDAYVKVYTDDRVYLKRSKIGDLEKQLPSDYFQRIHRSTIINISKIKALQPHLNGEQFVILKTDEKLKLSRTYKQNLEDLGTA